MANPLGQLAFNEQTLLGGIFGCLVILVILTAAPKLPTLVRSTIVGAAIIIGVYALWRWWPFEWTPLGVIHQMFDRYPLVFLVVLPVVAALLLLGLTDESHENG